MDYKKISRKFGDIADHEFARFIQIGLNKAYVRYFGIQMDEFDEVEKFKSLNALFTRKLKTMRKFDESKQALISPSDGEIYGMGEANELSALSVKGRTYDIKTLLDASFRDSDESGLVYANIYLSPKDYHHYHAPCDMKILQAHYIPGDLKSVARKWILRHDDLYSHNERVVLRCQISTNLAPIWLVFVGALNVGRMKFDFDPKIQTNANFGKASYTYDGICVKKGEHLGNFELGSTIIIIGLKNAIEFGDICGQKIKFAQTIGRIKFNDF